MIVTRKYHDPAHTLPFPSLSKCYSSKQKGGVFEEFYSILYSVYTVGSCAENRNIVLAKSYNKCYNAQSNIQ